MNQAVIVLFGVAFLLSLVVVAAPARSKGMGKRSPFLLDGLAVVVLGVVTAGFFWRVLFEEEVWVPAGGGDLASFLYPNFRFAAEWMKQGIVPLWNPYLYGGYPFAADIQSGLFYPINLLVLLLTPELTYRTMELLAIFHFFLAGLFMYLLMRGLRIGNIKGTSRPASLVSALAYMFSDLFIVHLGNLNMIAVAAWLPLIFLYFHRSVTERRISLSVWAGLFLGIALLAGHIQPFLYIVTALGLYLLYQVIADLSSGVKLRQISLLVVSFLILMVFAIGISALQLFPAYELSKLSVRSDITFELSTAYSLAPAQLVSLFVPSFFGRGADSYWGPWMRTEVGYLGLLPLCLSLFAVSINRSRLIYFSVLLAALSLLLAFGGYGILHGWFYQLVPGFDKVRAPARFIFIFDFAISIMAGIGADALFRPMLGKRRVILRRVARFLTFVWMGIGFGALPGFLVLLVVFKDNPGPALTRTMGVIDGIGLALVFLAGSIALLWARYYSWVNRAWLGVFAISLLMVDLAGTGYNVEIGKKDPTANFDHPGVVSFLQSDTSYYRIDSVTDVWDVWQPDTSLLNGVYDVMGVYNPMMLSTAELYWAKLGSRSSSLYDLLNAKYVIGHKGVPLDWGKFELVFDGDEKVNVYKNRAVMPRAFVVNNAVIEADDDAMFGRIHQDDFDPAKQVVLSSGRPLTGNGVNEYTAKIIDYSPNSLTVTTNSDSEGYLVLSEVYYSGWKAFVDGKETNVIPADYLFRAVNLPQGEHVVRFAFEPTSWKIGLTVSLFFIFLVVALGISMKFGLLEGLVVLAVSARR